MEIVGEMMSFITLVLTFLCISDTKAALVYSIWENLPENTLIGNIALDSNISTRHHADVVKKLKYQFLSNKIRIKVDENSGLLKTAEIIDRDAICPGEDKCTITADVVVSPASYFELIPVEVNVMDINDNTPTFPQDTISIRISELSTPGKAIHTLPSAVDPDSGTFALKGYELTTPEDSELFALEEIQALDGSTQLKLILLQAIDRETIPSHQLHVMAYDGDSPPKTATLTINLVVDDENDNPPIFSEEYYEVSVQEDAPIGTLISQVTASDMDDGVNSQIKYSLTPTTNHKFGNVFRIQANSGEIFLKSNLDFKTVSQYTLVVDASDQGTDSQSSQVKVIVKVLDINEAPEIRINTMTDSDFVEVKEGELPGTVIASVIVTDVDSGDNGKVLCGFNNPKFKLEQLGSYEKHFKVVTVETLDRESIDSYSISLTCRDKAIPPLSATKDVHVNVLDANDHAPVFTKRVYHGSIKENKSRRDFIVQVAASDKDIGENGRLEYSLSDDNSIVIKDLFEIDGSSGVVRSKEVLDHELYSSVTLNITVRDHGNLTLFASAQVIITIEDENDCKPEFTQKKSYSFDILEEQLPGIDVGNISATDDDSEPYNQIAYKLEADDINTLQNFRIDARTGLIKTTTKMDREKDPVFHFRVVASNPNSASWLSTTAIVTVSLLDINDHGPEVQFPNANNYTVAVPKNVKLGYVVSRVRAHDRDIGNNGYLTFALLDESNVDDEDKSPFHVDHPTGAVTAIRKLTSVAIGTQYNLSIIVRDHGKPHFKSVALLTIIITEESPYFHTTTGGIVIPDNVGYAGNGTDEERKPTSLHVVIGVACGSTLVIAGLMAAILILSCRSPRRRNQDQGKYNCRVEAQKMLNEKQERSADCSSDSASSEEDISPSLPPVGVDKGQPSLQQAPYSFTTSPCHHHQQQFGSNSSRGSPYPEANDGELPSSTLHHGDSGRGITLMEYDPAPAQTKPWSTPTGQTANQNPRTDVDLSGAGTNSPIKPKLTVCNSCVVTEDKNQFATRLVPLTDKEIEIHKILRFLHSQQDDSGDRCSDSMSTSDSGKGASVIEDCEAPNSHVKPVKQVHFMDQQQQKLPPPPPPHNQVTTITTPDGHSPPAPANGHLYQYPSAQRTATNRNCPSPLTTFANPSSFGNGMVGTQKQPEPYANGDGNTMPYQSNTAATGVKPGVNPSQGGSYPPAPSTHKYNHLAYSPGGARRNGSLPHKRTGSKELNKRYMDQRGSTLPHPGAREEDNVNGILGNLSDDSDGNSTMSGSYVLVPDDLPHHVQHLSQLRDSVV